jgi:hypothetical protein
MLLRLQILLVHELEPKFLFLDYLLGKSSIRNATNSAQNKPEKSSALQQKLHTFPISVYVVRIEGMVGHFSPTTVDCFEPIGQQDKWFYFDEHFGDCNGFFSCFPLKFGVL